MKINLHILKNSYNLKIIISSNVLLISTLSSLVISNKLDLLVCVRCEFWWKLILCLLMFIEKIFIKTNRSQSEAFMCFNETGETEDITWFSYFFFFKQYRTIIISIKNILLEWDLIRPSIWDNTIKPFVGSKIFFFLHLRI